MRNTITLMSIVLLLTACSSVKRNEKFLALGNYDEAIELAVKKIAKDKNSKKSKEHITLLEQAFAKVVDQDLRRIKFLEKDTNPGNVREIYFIYAGLESRQQLIRPLLPLKNGSFAIVDYTNEIIQAKNNYADFLFAEGNNFLNKNTVLDAREAHRYFEKLKNLQPNYFEVDKLLDEAHYQGTDFVSVQINNLSNQIIPRRLEQELLDFNTYELDDFWTEYHGAKQNGVPYSFGVSLNFKQIGVSPEQVLEKEYRRTKRIKDGWEYKLDRNGNVMKDSLGNDIKVDIIKVVKARVTYTEQVKSVLVGGTVVYRDFERKEVIDRHPLSSEFIFENIFARYRGDERALTEEDRRLLRNDFIPFPSNEQMVLDAGTDIKIRLSEILKQNSFR
jgi:hypothetical protein